MLKRFFRTLPTLTFALVGFVALHAYAETYPTRPVKIVIPYPAGGIVDISARLVTDRIAKEWGQAIVVENRPGANGNIGAAAVKKAPPDGYTLLVGSTFLTINHLIDQNAKVSAQDFLPIGTLGMPPNLLVVPASSPVKDLKDLIDLAKAKPGQINAANPGVGSSNHLGTEILEATAGIDLTLVGYKAQPPFIPDLLSGQLDFAIASAGLVSAHIRDGKLRPLAASYSQRLKNYPDLPTLAELGYAEATVLPWVGFLAPLGTPQAVLDKWASAIRKALDDPAVIQKYEVMEAVNPDLFLESFGRFLNEEELRWRKVVKERHLSE